MSQADRSNTITSLQHCQTNHTLELLPLRVRIEYFLLRLLLFDGNRLQLLCAHFLARRPVVLTATNKKS